MPKKLGVGVKLILNIKKLQNLTILPKKSINFCKTQHISKKTQVNPKKTQEFGKKLNVPEENAYPILQKSVKTKSLQYNDFSVRFVSVYGKNNAKIGKNYQKCEFLDPRK